LSVELCSTDIFIIKLFNPMTFRDHGEIKVGSVVLLSLIEEEVNGGIGIVLEKNNSDMYYVYRIPSGDKLWVEKWELHVCWSPE